MAKLLVVIPAGGLAILLYPCLAIPIPACGLIMGYAFEVTSTDNK